MRLSRLAMGIVAGLGVGIYTTSADPLGTGFTYQGELTVSGQPANGTFDFEFALFDALNGGVETGATIALDDVVVTNGVFSVELDFGAGPFAGDQQWVDIAVRNGASTGGFTGLLPRQQLTAAPYALHAEMVAMDAIGSAELASNSVSASEIQANAVGTSEIITTQVQRRVSGTCAAGTFATGVAQDGSMNCVADQVGVDAAGAVAAVLAADGDGSGLDADLLDGQNASEIIDASRIGTEITSVPITISQAGRYYLTQNLSADGSSSAAIQIIGRDVTIDFNGFTLSGPSSDPADNTQSGVWLRIADNARILNGTIRNFGGDGIFRAIASDGSIIGMTIEDVGGDGIDLLSSSAQNYLVRDTRVNVAGGTGIRLESGQIDSAFVVDAGGDGILIREGVVRNSTASTSGAEGIQCLGPCLVLNSVAGDNTGAGIVVTASGIERDNIQFNNGP